MNALWRSRATRAALAGTFLLAAAAVVPVVSHARPTQPQPSKAASAAKPASACPGQENCAQDLSAAFHRTAEEVLPSVVQIQVTARHAALSGQRQGNEQMNPFGNSPFGNLFRNHPELRQFFKQFPQLPSTPEYTHASGSGVIIDPSGIILTNNHVVDGATDVEVRLHDGRQFKATGIERDPQSDLAILHIHASGPLPAAQLGNSDNAHVGDWVLALGEPFGLEGTVTAGIISATGRNVGIASDGTFIQTDAAINPGNSGGPLVDLDGRVIGINTAISTQTGGYEGIGFAIPVNEAKWVAQQLIKTGHVARAYLGVGIQPLTPALAKSFGVQAEQGVVVTQVQPDSPAAKAGLKTGDVITGFAGKKVTSPEQLRGMVEASKINSSQPLQIVRNGKQETVNATMLKQPPNYGLASIEEEPTPETQPSFSLDKLGMQVAPVTAEAARQLGLKSREGALIKEVQPGGAADQAGLEAGMVIVQANHKPVKGPEDLQALSGKTLEKGLLLLVRSQQGSRFVVLRPQR
jgi:serine protease Do